MQAKSITLFNKGMRRDESVSKSDMTFAFENRNVRIIQSGVDSSLSVVNERGTKPIDIVGVSGGVLKGKVVGWAVLNKYLVIFTHSSETEPDFIYRTQYNVNDITGDESFETLQLYNGNLGFADDTVLDTLPYFETEDIQKVYWVDGQHPLRSINIVATSTERYSWEGKNNIFDSTVFVNPDVTARISKDNTGSTRPNGVVQYFLTYYNIHGSETGIVWASDLVYLTPPDYAGPADGTNNIAVTIELTVGVIDFTRYRLYSIFRSSLNNTVAYIVADGAVSGTTITVVDDGAHLTAEDVDRLLYLGNQPVSPSTLTQKDNTLFLGDLKQTKSNFSVIKGIIDGYFATNSTTGIETSGHITFGYSFGYEPSETSNIYNHDIQLAKRSSEILTFKGGEKYRFALCFKMSDGTETPAFWIGDKENDKYPRLYNDRIQTAVAYCTIDDETASALLDAGVRYARLMIAEATYADRSVKAQGFLNPTVFNAWERFNNRVYAMPSWIIRPRMSEVANRHFETIHRSDTFSGEIECNYWTEGYFHEPFYTMTNGKIDGTFEENTGYTAVLIVVGMNWVVGGIGGTVDVFLGTGTLTTLQAYEITNENKDIDTLRIVSDGTIIKHKRFDFNAAAAWQSDEIKKQAFYDKLYSGLIDAGVSADNIPNKATTDSWYNRTGHIILSPYGYYNSGQPSLFYSSFLEAANGSTTDTPSADRWVQSPASASGNRTTEASAAYAVKNLMFIDESVVTLDSPEIAFNAVSVDNTGYKLRIIGLSTFSGSQSDYTVDAAHGVYTGDNVLTQDFSRSSFTRVGGLLAWPLWIDSALQPTGGTTPDASKADPSDYTPSGSLVYYWIHMWQSGGSVPGFSPTDYPSSTETLESKYGIRKKIFANLHFSNETKYSTHPVDINLGTSGIRQFTQTSTQLLGITVGGETKMYDGNVKAVLTMPGTMRYPKWWSPDIVTPSSIGVTPGAYLYSDLPVTLSYAMTPHAVISLRENYDSSDSVYMVETLPQIAYDSSYTADEQVSGDIHVSWKGNSSKYISNTAIIWDTEDGLNSGGGSYILIGEIYKDFSNTTDTRYGGVSDEAVAANRFIPAGEWYDIERYDSNGITISGIQGDTYFQRWDCLRTLPYGEDSVNNVVDITSLMLETHINIDGITNKYRGTDKLASVDTSNYTNLNPVYSQQNNFIVKHQVPLDTVADNYSDTITWTLEKHPEEDVDSWTHITLANTLKLDGNNGKCTALRRFADRLYAFQDKGIAEIMFNSRVQLAAGDGVPVELSNSGKVDGKRYITDKYGCQRKETIAEGKGGIYFVDDYNKAFCGFDGGSVTDISLQKSFKAWFEKNHSNVAKAFYDATVNEIYLKDSHEDSSTGFGMLAYSEPIGSFSSFYDYHGADFITALGEKSVSCSGNALWLNRHGYYCRFFDDTYPFYTTYKVAPEPRTDKIWSNIEYRADVYEVLDDSANTLPGIDDASISAQNGIYKENETFSLLEIDNEFQHGSVSTTTLNPRKRFRIWRYVIPRADINSYNKFGLDRIRNPWIQVKMEKTPADESKDLMQIHDVTVQYFE